MVDLAEEMFMSTHDRILQCLNKVSSDGNARVTTATLISHQQYGEQSVHHVLVLADGAIPVITHYQQHLLNFGFWMISTMQSKRRLQFNNMWHQAVQSGKASDATIGIPRHVVMAFDSETKIDNARVTKPLDNKLEYVCPDGLKLCMEAETFFATLHDQEMNVLDSVAGPFVEVVSSQLCSIVWPTKYKPFGSRQNTNTKNPIHKMLPPTANPKTKTKKDQ